MVTQTWGCAQADAAAARTPPMTRAVRRRNRVMSLAKGLPKSRPSQSNMECGGMEARNFIRTGAKFTSSLHTRGAAVGARIVAALERSARMQDHGAGMPHRACVRLAHDLHVMAG